MTKDQMEELLLAGSVVIGELPNDRVIARKFMGGVLFECDNHAPMFCRDGKLEVVEPGRVIWCETS